MVRFPSLLRASTLLAVVGVVVSAFVVERRILDPRVAARRPGDEVAYWEAHVTRNDRYPASRIRLGLAYQRAGRLDEAQREYEVALALDRDAEAAAIGRQGILLEKGERELALAGLEDYARDHSRCAICWNNLAAAYLDLGRLDEARVAADALLASELTVTSGMYSATNFHFQAFVMAGLVYAARGDPQRAVTLFREAIEWEPQDPRGYFFEARSLAADAQPRAALAALVEAEARLAPGDADLRQKIEGLRNRLGGAAAGGELSRGER